LIFLSPITTSHNDRNFSKCAAKLPEIVESTRVISPRNVFPKNARRTGVRVVAVGRTDFGNWNSAIEVTNSPEWGASHNESVDDWLSENM
jgi:hypothetical protein